MKYNEKYPYTLTGLGLLSRLTISESVPWFTEDGPTVIAIEQSFGVQYGFREMVTSFATLTDEMQSNILLSYYLEKWKKLWNAYKLQYNPLNDYEVTETSSRKIDTTVDNTEARTTSDLENTTNNVEVTGTSVNNSSYTEDIYGLGSTSGSPANKGTENASSTTGDITDGETNRSLTGKRDTTTNETTDSLDVYKSDKAGNIGYTSRQELIRRELELWGTPYFKTVFSDIANFIFLSVY